jgi:hypothetical protein
MGIFDRIRNVIFHRGQSQAQAQPRSSGQGAATTNRATPAAGGTTAPPAAPPAQAPAAASRPATTAPAAASTQPQATTPTARPMQVDVEQVLEGLAAEKGQKLNWRTSIVDLMKLLDLDPTLENRKELARELGYTGSLADSATMNVWLHRQVMRKLAENGGMVPADLRD